MTEYEDFKPFFEAMIMKMKQHDDRKGDSWKGKEGYVAHNLRTKLWEEFTDCIERNYSEDIKNPDDFVDLANICAMIYMRHYNNIMVNDTIIGNTIINRNFKQSFPCLQCGETVRITDYGHKDRNLYYSLARSQLCEECARSSKT